MGYSVPQTPKTITTNRNKKHRTTLSNRKSLSIFSSPCDDGWLFQRELLLAAARWFCSSSLWCFSAAATQRKKCEKVRRKRHLSSASAHSDRPTELLALPAIHFCRRTSSSSKTRCCAADISIDPGAAKRIRFRRTLAHRKSRHDADSSELHFTVERWPILANIAK